MRIAVVIVSYNTRDLLRRAIASVGESVESSGLEPSDISIIVVDNGSADGSADMVSREFPHVCLLALEDNLGFTRANNLALEALGFRVQTANGTPHVTVTANPAPAPAHSPDFILLLNSDAELVDDALGRMARFLEEHPSAGACGPRLAYADGSFQHGAFQFPGLFQVALDLFPLSKLPGAHRIRDSRVNGRYPARLWEREIAFPVDFVLGASMMMRGDAIQQIGGLDEGFFMYCEEMDWCLRLAQAGRSTYAVPTARVIHHEAQSSRQSPWPSFRRLWRSRLRFYAKHRDRYPRIYFALMHALIRTGLRSNAMRTRRRFAQGCISGIEAREALDAYAYVAQLKRQELV